MCVSRPTPSPLRLTLHPVSAQPSALRPPQIDRTTVTTIQGGRTMRHGNRWLTAVLIIVGLGLAACSQASADEDTASHSEPAHVEPIAGSELSRVTLTEKASDRLDIQTAQV